MSVPGRGRAVSIQPSFHAGLPSLGKIAWLMILGANGSSHAPMAAPTSLQWQLVVALTLLVLFVIAQCCCIGRLVCSRRPQQEPAEEDNAIYLSPNGIRAHLTASCGTLSHLNTDDLTRYAICMRCMAEERKRKNKKRK